MNINHNLANIAPIDLKSSGFSALHKVSENKIKEEKLTLVTQAKHLAGSKQAEKSVKDKELDAKELVAVITKISEQVQNVHRDLTFSIDEESGRNVVTILDTKSKEIIKQFPSEELLALARHLNEQMEVDDKGKAINLFSSTA
ncbi:MAG: flagellar protein FlaG [Methylococcales bacterium]|nr:flagellar protein FlaG [Methylococcales bacterium]